ASQVVAAMAWMICLLFLFSGNAWGSGNTGAISATLEPQNITLGNISILSVHTSGAGAGKPVLPDVDGLQFITAGQRSEYQFINGKVSSSVSYIYRVVPVRAGDFTIPPITAGTDFQEKTSTLTLHVAQSQNRKTHPAPSQARQPQPSKSSTRIEENEIGEAAFLRVIPATHRPYVGETVPVKIRAYFRHGIRATLNSLPVPDENAFSFQSIIEKPRQTEEVINGRAFSVLTWDTTMSAVKEGEYPFRVNLDATLQIPDRSRRRSSFGKTLFDDSFFNGFFGGVREEEIKISSNSETMSVLPLPKAGRPDNFNGAIGGFSLSAEAVPKECMVGDPITLKMVISGNGNFDRVKAPSFKSDRGWKTYTPETRFNPSGNAGCTGEKLFEQAIIPLDTSIKKVPPVEFSYFDTKTRKYISLETRSIPITIIPSSGTARNMSTGSAQYSKDSTTSGTQNTPGTASLAPIHISLGHMVKDLIPTVTEPWFIGAQGLSLCMLIGGIFLGRRNRRLNRNPEIMAKKRVNQNIERLVKLMDQAIAGHDVQGFFNACRSASQERLGQIWSVPPEVITLVDVKDRLPEGNANIRQIFETADAVAFSGQSFSQEELKQYRRLIMTELEDLEKN
ncbi:MAG: BatD family protein, partial [Thermodesulfobacteriota bacterium]|nr:BatD family protein [Thermodesulfobacteriota bacterium]